MSALRSLVFCCAGWVGCGGDAPGVRVPVAPAVTLDVAAAPACHQPLAEAVPESGPDGVAAVVSALGQHDVVLLGEHHGDVAEIDFLVSVLDRVDRPLLLAMELVPSSAQATADRAVSAPTLDPDAWPKIVGERYWPAPFHVAEYERVLAAVHAARQRGVELRLVGLAPDCRIPSAATPDDRAAAISCFRTRDAAMLNRLRDVRAQHPGHAVLISAGWRHVAGMRLPDAPSTLGLELPAHWSSYRVLLAGSEPALPDGTRTATCGGTPQALADVADAPVALRALATPWSLSDCVETRTAVSRPVSAAFDLVIGLPSAPPPTIWDAEAFSEVSLHDRAAWSRVRRVLMDQPTPTASPDSLAVWAAKEGVEQVRAQKARQLGCRSEAAVP